MEWLEDKQAGLLASPARNRAVGSYHESPPSPCLALGVLPLPHSLVTRALGPCSSGKCPCLRGALTWVNIDLASSSTSFCLFLDWGPLPTEPCCRGGWGGSAAGHMALAVWAGGISESDGKAGLHGLSKDWSPGFPDSCPPQACRGPRIPSTKLPTLTGLWGARSTRFPGSHCSERYADLSSWTEPCLVQPGPVFLFQPGLE